MNPFDIYTAASRSKTLKEHEEAFKSVNGYEPTTPPDTDAEIMGIISKLAMLKTITFKEISQASFQIKKLSGGTVKVSKARDMVARSLGYANYGTMVNLPEIPGQVPNLLHGRGNLGGILSDVNAATAATKEEIRQTIAEIFDLVKSSSLVPDFPMGKISDLAVWITIIHQHMVHYGLDADDPKTALIFRLACASKFPKSLFKVCWRRVYEGGGRIRREVFGRGGAALLREVCIEYMQPEDCYEF